MRERRSRPDAACAPDSTEGAGVPIGACPPPRPPGPIAGEMLEAVEGTPAARPEPDAGRGPAPALGVAAELVRAGASALLLPLRTAAFLARAPAVRRAVRADLATTSAV